MIAGVKNVAEGGPGAKGVDAAKVFREIGESGLEELGLPPIPPASRLARQGRALSNLDEDAFQMVVNGLVPENFAAAVGELITGGKAQVAALDVLARTQPANETQARAIVQQIRAQGFETRQTSDLFGDSEIAESLFLERAKVIDAVGKRLRKNRTTFSTLLAEERTITGRGNVLNQEVNRAQATESAEILGAVNRLANTKGPVSDAINAAARSVAAGKKPGLVAGDVIRTLQTADARNPGARAAAGTAGQAEQGGSRLADNKLEIEFNDALSPAESAIEARFALEDAHDKGEISDAIYQGFRGQAPGDQKLQTASPEARPAAGGRTQRERGEGGPRGDSDDELDLLGEDPRQAQALADATRIKDAARNTGQDSLETADPADLFSQARNQVDLEDLEVATGFREDGSIKTRSAREVLDELDEDLDRLKAVDECLTE